MKVALAGYGRMGREIERLASQMGHAIAAVFDEFQPLTESSSLQRAEVLIDFSVDEAVLGVLGVAAQKGVPVVEGTTGWYHALDEALKIKGLTMVYSPNFSMGVYRFTQLVRVAAQLLGSLGSYDAYVHERHHAGKADSPSGTAARLADVLVSELPEKSKLLSEICHRRISPEELHVTATRAGRNPGSHEVGFDSDYDSIQLRHDAHGRVAFAYGALKAAEWIVGRRGIFTMDDWMDSTQEPIGGA
jgi:4-hydroxy-tetrahydrodipicolinate reductase